MKKKLNLAKPTEKINALMAWANRKLVCDFFALLFAYFIFLCDTQVLREKLMQDEKLLKPKMRGVKGTMGEKEEVDYLNVSDPSAVGEEEDGRNQSDSYFEGFERTYSRGV